MEITKEILLTLIQVALCLEDYATVQILTGKCFNLSELEAKIFLKKGEYHIVGAGVIEKKILTPPSDNKNFINHIIPIRTQEEFDSFLKYMTTVEENKDHILKEEECCVDEKIKKTIREYITGEKEVKDIFSIVKESSNLSGEKLLTNMDIVYKILNSQQNTTAIFMSNPKTRVNKNTYSVKDRKAGGYLDE